MQSQASEYPTVTDWDIAKLVPLVAEILQRYKWHLVTAESCTGGWLTKVITDMPGSSAWLEGGFVTYSNDVKKELLGVTEEVLARCGAVSMETVLQMAQGALLRSHAEVAVAITGIAGPDGGSVDKPVGTVWFAWAMPNIPIFTDCKYFGGNRADIRRQAVHYSLQMLITLIDRGSNANETVTTTAPS